MDFGAVIGDPSAHPFEEGWQGGSMPFLQWDADQCAIGAPVEVGQDSELVHEVRMPWPARRDHIGGVEDEFVVDPHHDSVEPGPQLGT